MADSMGELYEQLIALSEIAFAGEHYEAAYHALVAAMHTAYDDGNPDGIEMAKRMAQEQIDWLDAYRPNHTTGSTAAMHRGQRSIYESLQLQADAMLLRVRSRYT
ncbi:MAG TPA: hypothetical protein VFO07_16070 [Roseiflexaceae bacterium]|nr:hypothetical protein [Roseiflexaceae bacterium]